VPAEKAPRPAPATTGSKPRKISATGKRHRPFSPLKKRRQARALLIERVWTDDDAALTHALGPAGCGIAVFPCKIDKRPLTGHGFKDATTDKAIITEYWARWPEALIGVPTGINFDVVDLDLQHEAAQRWYAEHPLPLTRSHQTRSGGLHLLFKPDAAVKCTTNVIAPHVDTPRGRGGYVVWWPACGFVVRNHHIIATMPEWIVEALNPPSPAPTTASASAFTGEGDATNLDLAIEHAVTADMADGQPLPPLIEDGHAWHLMHRAGGVSDDLGLSRCLGVASQRAAPSLSVNWTTGEHFDGTRGSTSTCRALAALGGEAWGASAGRR
jgi:hypothetical protein